MRFPHVKPPLGIPIDPSNPLAKGLVGYWPMNEGTGNIVQDLSGNGNDGDIGINLAWGYGKFGSDIDFAGTDNDDDSDNVIDFPGITVIPGDFTLAHWQMVPPTAWMGFCTFGFAEEAGLQTYIEKYYTQTAAGPTTHKWEVRNNWGAGITLTSDRNCQRNVWEFTALTRRGNTVRHYVNGVEQSTTGALVGSIDVSHLHQIGWAQNHKGVSYIYRGKLGPVYYYGRALTASEIQKLNYDPFGIIQPTFSVWWYSGIGGEAPAAYGQVIMISN